MMLPEEYISKCLQIATEALQKIATWNPIGTHPAAILEAREIAQQALNEMRRLP